MAKPGCCGQSLHQAARSASCQLTNGIYNSRSQGVALVKNVIFPAHCRRTELNDNAVAKLASNKQWNTQQQLPSVLVYVSAASLDRQASLPF